MMSLINEVKPAEESLFIEQYRQLEQALGDAKQVALNTLELGANLGATHERIVQSQGKDAAIEFLRSIGARHTFIQFSRRCHLTKKKGHDFDPNQLSLALSIDEYRANEPVQRVKRGSNCRWMRYAGQAHTALKKDLEEKPLSEWTDDEKTQAYHLLRPIIKMAKMFVQGK